MAGNYAVIEKRDSHQYNYCRKMVMSTLVQTLWNIKKTYFCQPGMFL
ncbi:hypothetical protein MX658_16090 [Klebsiella pneumoniae]|nr:hypothetical protein MX658_16090 [Klebsiella pneumoniae]